MLKNNEISTSFLRLLNGIRLLREGGGYQLSIKHIAGPKINIVVFHPFSDPEPHSLACN